MNMRLPIHNRARKARFLCGAVAIWLGVIAVGVSGAELETIGKAFAAEREAEKRATLAARYVKTALAQERPKAAVEFLNRNKIHPGRDQVLGLVKAISALSEKRLASANWWSWMRPYISAEADANVICDLLSMLRRALPAKLKEETEALIQHAYDVHKDPHQRRHYVETLINWARAEKNHSIATRFIARNEIAVNVGQGRRIIESGGRGSTDSVTGPWMAPMLASMSVSNSGKVHNRRFFANIVPRLNGQETRRLFDALTLAFEQAPDKARREYIGHWVA